MRHLSQTSPADMNADQFTALVAAELALGDLHFKSATDKKPVHAYLLHLRSLLKKSEEYFSSHVKYADLQTLYEKVLSKEKEFS